MLSLSGAANEAITQAGQWKHWMPGWMSRKPVFSTDLNTPSLAREMSLLQLEISLNREGSLREHLTSNQEAGLISITSQIHKLTLIGNYQQWLSL